MKKLPPEAGNIRTCLATLLLKLLLPLSLIVLFLLCARFIPEKITYEYKAAEPDVTHTANHGTVPASSLYILRSKDGKIAIFEDNGDFVKTIDISLSELPEYDRLLLSEGIVTGKDELSELIESLLS